STDADGQIVSYLWSFGDGTTSTQSVTTHAYAAAGTYALSLTVTDDDGATASASGQVTVTGSTTTPTVRLTLDRREGTVQPGATERVTARFDAAGLVAGRYQAQIQLTSNGGNVTIPVNVTVAANVSVAEPESLPESVELMSNYPNPFNPETTIPFRLSEAGAVRVSVYDVTGRLVRVLWEGDRGAGRHTVRWDGRTESGQGVASGVYLYRLEVRALGGGGSVERLTGTMLLLK
ncbi:MAG: PKD domain-containing protein, partial [Bacteroidota bacterium]